MRPSKVRFVIKLPQITVDNPNYLLHAGLILVENSGYKGKRVEMDFFVWLKQVWRIAYDADTNWG